MTAARPVPAGPQELDSPGCPCSHASGSPQKGTLPRGALSRHLHVPGTAGVRDTASSADQAGGTASRQPRGPGPPQDAAWVLVTACHADSFPCVALSMSPAPTSSPGPVTLVSETCDKSVYTEGPEGQQWSGAHLKDAGHPAAGSGCPPPGCSLSHQAPGSSRGMRLCDRLLALKSVSRFPASGQCGVAHLPRRPPPGGKDSLCTLHLSGPSKGARMCRLGTQR